MTAPSAPPNPPAVGALYAPGPGSRQILSIIVADLALLQIQPIPSGQAMAIVLNPVGDITTQTHHVAAGAVVLGPPPVVPPPTPTLADLRAMRDGLLARTLWAVSEDTPLTNQSRNAVRAYRADLRTWLTAHPGVVPPDPPAFVYS